MFINKKTLFIILLGYTYTIQAGPCMSTEANGKKKRKGSLVVSQKYQLPAAEQQELDNLKKEVLSLLCQKDQDYFSTQVLSGRQKIRWLKEKKKDLKKTTAAQTTD